jgi:hypothetical protein
VLEASEALYRRGVGLLVPTMDRADSKWARKYGINQGMTPDLLSFLMCLTMRTAGVDASGTSWRTYTSTSRASRMLQH